MNAYLNLIYLIEYVHLAVIEDLHQEKLMTFEASKVLTPLTHLSVIQKLF